jgi:hypothetical protein
MKFLSPLCKKEAMKKTILLLAVSVSCGCVASMRATSSCAYTPKMKERWTDKEATAACQFSLEAPIKKVNDAKTFAESFRLMFNALPEMDGVVKPTITMEIKKPD